MIDFVVFPISGVIMDRFGRLYSIVPAFTVMAIGLVMLGLADDATDVAIASVLIGAGNGVTSGAVLTLGADLAPEGEEGPYLAGFTLVSNLGLFSAHSSSAPSPTPPGSMSRPSCSAASCSPVSPGSLVIGETGRRPPNPTPDEAPGQVGVVATSDVGV